jgi:hypothetical protein
MFHGCDSDMCYAGTQTGDNGCRDGNNICWMPKSNRPLFDGSPDGCNVADQRCALLTGLDEGVVYAVRLTPVP